MRRVRKKEHIENYLKTSYRGDTLLGDVFISHNSLPDLNFDEIDTSTEFLGKKINNPIMINAMTGGSDFSQEINKDLATLAKELGIPMAVGSETIALEDSESEKSFRVVREIVGPEGIVIANLSGLASLEEAKKAIEIVDGDAIQLHLNMAQELVMEEGDREFKGVLNNIESIAKGIDKPLIIKEVGFGVSYEVGKKLYDSGVRYLDISGYGGTNFIEIENLRSHEVDFSELYSWGIPTAASLVQCRKLPDDMKLVASGGIRNSMDIVKSLVLGADIAAISGELLAYLVHGGYANAKDYLESNLYKMRVLMMLLGKGNIEELKKTDYKLTGKLKEII
ncbi:type 2 isopentenyl-diphosphate Delta-isomerase [Gudongella sp. DL1XJH-153]|uniref:type 2 isopentenyl-diphosphate Delta-isomerase n=1 Tax=Gudongella sp. DL1XJH-153 TaxID=3409804 RepID=UPI003BB4AB7C